MTDRLKLAVLDANAFWTEQLFRQVGGFTDVLLLKPRDFRAHRAKTASLYSDHAPRRVADRVWELRLSMPPGWMFSLWRWSQHRFEHAIRNFVGRDSLALVITFPQYRGLFTTLKPARRVYYNLDDYRDNWPRHRLRVPQWEADTVNAADLTICIAAHRVKVLAERHPRCRPRIHHLPLGCTPEFMADSMLSASRPHLSALGTLRPVAGYIGALNYRFDFALIADVATRLPDVTFALGGRVQEDGDAAWRAGLARARMVPNVKFLGWIEHAKLGESLSSFDVLLIPYSHCNFNTNACPAKLWDYLGTGKPIVANDANPETLLWREVVRVGANAEAFALAVRDALEEQGTIMRERRLQIAREHTWERLGGQLERMLLAT